MDSLKFIIVEDNDDWRSLIKNILTSGLKLNGETVSTVQIEEAEDRVQALHLLEKFGPHIAIVDNQLKHENGGGLTLIRQMKEKFPEIIAIMVTSEKSPEVAASVIDAGAFDFIVKPHIDDQLRIKLAIAARMITLETGVLDSFIIGKSAMIKIVHDRVRKAAAQKGAVILTGATGTGKSLIARAIHRISSRSNQPFLEINCASIPGSLFESEFFGYKKGAHSSATSDKPGTFELANGGILLLDEIAEIPYEFQAKLLSVLDSRIIRPLGATKETKLDIRIIAATNQNLQERVQQKLFREDLFYRINGFPIHVPSLASRKEDIALLARHFILQTERYDLASSLPKDAIDYLESLPWPGNVRQLNNFIQRAIAETEGNVLTTETFKMLTDFDRLSGIPPSDFCVAVEENESGGDDLHLKIQLDVPLTKVRNNFEKAYIEAILRKYNNNVTKAAQALNMARTYLHEKMKILGISVD